MAKEILAIPEEYLEEVITIIRTGLKNSKKLTPQVKKQLEKWCKEEEEYLKELNEEE
jgi:hypothetical protein